MSRKWYGSLNNRVEENKQFCETIEVGTGMTEYMWSDRKAYEVVEVKDQKHVSVRMYDHIHNGDAYENKWILESNESNPVYAMTKRGDYWYWTVTCTVKDLEDIESRDETERLNGLLWLCHNGFDEDVVRARGKQTKYHKATVSFGVADYYHDYEF